MIRPHRGHPLWLAYILHRLSGLALAMFLPAHFYVLSLALTAPKNLNDFLRWADNPLVGAAEFGLVFSRRSFFGGLRLMAFEFRLEQFKNLGCGNRRVRVHVASGFLLVKSDHGGGSQ